MKRRLFAILLCVAVVISILPQQAFALLGALTRADDVQHKTITVTNAPDGTFAASTPAGKYYMLYNDYICFILRPDGCTTTVPTRLYKAYIEAMRGSEYNDRDGSIIKMFPVTEQYQYNYGRYVFLHHVVSSDSPRPQNVEFGTDNLLAHYKVGGDVIDSTVMYTLVKVDNGATEGNLPLNIYADENDSGRGWGIKMNAFMKYNEDRWDFPNNEDYIENGVKVELVTTHLRFAKQEELTEGGLIELSYYDVGYYENELWHSRILSTRKLSRIDIPYSDVSIMSNGSFILASEAYTDSFGADNQFVALGSGYLQSVEGHTSEVAEQFGGEYADHYSYNSLCSFPNYNGSQMYLGSTFTTYSTGCFFPEIGIEFEEGMYEAAANGLWGFRDMYTGNEYEIPEDDDYVWNLPAGDRTLGIVKDEDTVFATPGVNAQALQDTYGENLVAVFRGMFALDNTTNEYVFLDGAAALSSTVAAFWEDSTGHFRVGKNGTVSSEGLSLTCPAYDFYQPNAEGGLEFSFSEGFLITIDPEKNDAFFSVEIPGSTTDVTGAAVGLDGHLTFCGEMSVTTSMVDIAEIKLSRVGLSFDDRGGAHIDGIEASGSVDMEEVMGAMASNVSAEINTFDGEEKYGFALDLNIPNVFEVEAELTLVRLKNGSLAPDALMLALSVGEIPIAPPALSITGVGGGFRDLAETLNDDPYSLPPLKVSVSMNAKILEAIDGRGTLTAGLGYCSLALSNVSVLDTIPLGIESQWELFTADTSRVFQKVRYEGISARYLLNVSMQMPTSLVDIMSFSKQLDLDMFAGRSGASLYFELDADAKLTGSLKLPKKVGFLTLPDKVGGYELASAEFGFALGGKMAIDFANSSFVETVTKCAESMVGACTISYKNTLFGIFDTSVVASIGQKNVRLDVGCFGSTIGHTFEWGKQGKGVVLACDETKGNSSYTICALTNFMLLGSTQDDKSVVGDADLLAANGITMEQIASDESAYTVALSESATSGQLMFTLTPQTASTLTVAELESMFTVKKSDGTAVPLMFCDYDTESGEEITVGNAYTATGGYDSILDENISSAVVIMLPNNNETYTITGADATDNPVAFDIECIGAELPESIASGSVSELKEGNEYVLRAYLMDSEGEYYSAGEDVELTNEDNGKSIEVLFPVSSTVALDNVPSGSYTVVYRLMQKVRGVNENGEPAFDDVGNPFYYYIDLSDLSGATVTNTNPYQVSDPLDVTLSATGNEVLFAQWNAPTGMESAEVVGYNVAVEQFIDGAWVDTGAHYSVEADDAGNIPTSISMAITATGVDDGMMKPDNTYRANVASVVDFSVTEDGETVTVQRTGAGVYSQSVYLAPATPPTLTYTPSPTVGDNYVKSMYTKPNQTVSINAAAFGGKIITSVTATNLNDDSAITVIENNRFVVPEFYGSLTVMIIACDSAGDKTVDYITLLRDDTAPIITLDSSNVIANQDGSYTITGVTEPGATVKDMLNATIPVAEDGSFTYNGQLDSDEEGDTVVITATDAAGNTGSVMLAVGTKLAAPLITPEGGTYDDSFSVEISHENANAELRYTLDGSEPTQESTLYAEPFEITADTTVKAKAFLAGMEESETVSCTYTFTRHTVTFVDWDGGVLKTEEVMHGASATAPTSPSRTGYVFAGWDKDFTNVITDLTVNATYTINSYTVTFMDGYSGEVILAAQVEHGSNAVLPTPPEHEGYTFTGWDSDGTNITADITITAQYEANALEGDVTGDGRLNTGDAVMILRQCAGLITFTAQQEELADFSNDGRVNTGDAVAVLRYCAGL